MIRIFFFFLCLSATFSAWAQNNSCSNATPLCANNTTSSSTTGATAAGSDPAISCGDNTVNNSVWFTVLAINNGNATITVSQINNTPGLEMEVYTGICGSLSPVVGSPCASGVGPNGSMNVTFATTAGTTYYIMVDGTNGNQEAFTILATTSNDAIIARPDANFNTNPANGCIPLSDLLQNTTTLHGGTNITYQWRIDGGPYITSSGSDTTVIFNTLGTHTVDLRVCNAECGCKSISQDIVVQNLFPTISATPLTGCIGSSIDFTGDALILPDPPTVDPNVTNWSWNFGDPNSGVNNTANGQFPSHTFVGPGASFTVQLIVDGTCGPDTTSTIINLNPQPVVYAGPDQTICEGATATLTATVLVGTLPLQDINWVGPGTIGCSNCLSTTVDNLPPGGPYTFSVDITDANGCTADTTVNITVLPKPTVDVGSDQTVCAYQPTNLNATPTAGTPPFSYQWTPAAGLDNDTISNPTAIVNVSTTYCVHITDSSGCVSDDACVNIDIYPPPTISPTIPVLCASNPNLTDTFNVSGAGAGSVYSWVLSPSHSLITGANVDSSSIYVTFPSAAGIYFFVAIVTDGVTGCTDTVATVFSVTNGLNMSVTGPSQICSGQSATLTANGAITFAWTANPAYAFADSTLDTQTVSPLVTTVFTITGTAGTCAQTITDTLVVNPTPVATAANILPFCGCSVVTLNGTGSTPGMNYLWTSFGGATIADSSALNTTASICVSETFVLTVTDPATGCFASDTTTATTSTKPDAAVVVSPTVICLGVSTLITLDGTGSDVTPGTTYHWSSNNPSAIITDTTALVTDATVSSATVFYLTVTNALGCDSIVSDTVHIYPPPVFIASPGFLCTSDPLLQSTLTVFGAGVGSTYTWTVPACAVPNSASGTSQTFDVTGCGVGSFGFFVDVTDAATGCFYSLSQSVNVVTSVVLIVSNDTTICEGSSVTLSASGANTFLWNTIPADTTSSITMNGLLASGSPYQFIVTGTTGSCSATDTIIVTVDSIPVTSAITGNNTACAYDAGYPYFVTPFSGNYTWTVTGGVISSGQGTGIITVDWDSAGTGTITVVDTNAFGCAGTLQTFTVTINPLPTPSFIFGPDTVCENSVASYFIIPAAGSTYQWSVAGGTISGVDTLFFVSVTWGSAGPGFISVQETNAAGCFANQDTTIFINPQPAPILVNGNNSICSTDTMQWYYTPVDTSSTYTWNVTGGTIISISSETDSILVNWGTSLTGTISAWETNSLGCSSDSVVFLVTLNPQPIISGLADSVSVCRYTAYPVSDTVNVGTISWTTSGDGTFDDSTLATPVYTPGVSDTGYVTLTVVVTNFPCADVTDSIVLFFTTPPVVTLTASQTTVCPGDSVTLTATGGGNYSWTPNNADTTAIVVVYPVDTTMYYVTVNNGFSCSTRDSITINVDSIPLTSPITGVDSACARDSGLVYSVVSTSGNYVWTISNGTIISGQGTDSVYVQWDTAGVGTITVVDTNAAGCSGIIQTLIVTIYPIPVTSLINGQDTVCENSTITYFVTSPGPLYNWSVSGGTIIGSSNQSFVSITWGAAGVGTVSVNETSLSGCSGAYQDTTIIINPVPLPVIMQGDTILCEGDSLQVYSTLVTAGSTYNWNITGGSILSGQGADSVHVNWGTSSGGTISVTETNSFGCTSDSTVSVVVINPHIVASALPDSGTVCQNSSFPIFGSANAGTIHWTSSGTGTFSDTTIQSPTYTPSIADTGTYVTLTMVVSNPPCPDTTIYVVVFVSPSPKVTATGTLNTICAGQFDTLSAVATGANSFLWSPTGDTTSFIVVSPPPLPPYSNVYYVTVTNNYGCTATDSVIVTVIPHGTPIGSGNQVICIGDSAYLSGIPQNAGGLHWSSSDTLGIFLPDAISFNVTYVPGPTDSLAGTAQIFLVTTGACYNDTDIITITISQFPAVFAGYDTTLTEGPDAGSTVQLNGSVSSVSGGYWTTSGTGTFSPDTNSLNAVYTPSASDYNLDSIIIILTTVGGCRIVSDFLVIEIAPFTIPNVITPYPTSPGFNDFFVIKNLPPNTKLKIWDRWGLIIFDTDYYLNDWDAAEVKADTYYYVLITTRKEFHGFIKVIREE